MKTTYNQEIENLKKSINEKGFNDLFKISILNLQNDFKQQITTDFIYNLFKQNGFNQKLKNRMQYLLKKNGFTTTEIFKAVKKEYISNRIISINDYEYKVFDYKNDCFAWKKDTLATRNILTCIKSNTNKVLYQIVLK